jgi:hypothetical protein
MIELFFISVLVVTTRLPSDGWIQWTESFSVKKVCEEKISKDYEEIQNALKKYMKKELVQIKEFRCMTYKEAVILNTKLGHLK